MSVISDTVTWRPGMINVQVYIILWDCMKINTLKHIVVKSFRAFYKDFCHKILSTAALVQDLTHQND